MLNCAHPVLEKRMGKARFSADHETNPYDPNRN